VIDVTNSRGVTNACRHPALKLFDSHVA
jgi:hypothetical protein